MTKACYAGSFNPFHGGHFSVVEKACELFDEVHIVVAINPEKPRSSDEEARVDYIKGWTKESFPNLVVTKYEGFVVDYCMENGIKYLVRGLRNGNDLQYESKIQDWNATAAPHIQTVYFLAPPHLRDISSTKLRER